MIIGALRFSQRYCWRLLSCTLHCLVRMDVSKARGVFIFRIIQPKISRWIFYALKRSWVKRHSVYCPGNSILITLRAVNVGEIGDVISSWQFTRNWHQKSGVGVYYTCSVEGKSHIRVSVAQLVELFRDRLQVTANIRRSTVSTVPQKSFFYYQTEVTTHHNL